MTDLTNTAPKRIYLDIGDQFALERVLSGGLSWQALDGVTWSEDNATSHGVPYVRADLADNEASALRQIISDCAAAVGNGTGVGPTCSLDFMRLLPDEIRAAVTPTPAASRAATPLTEAERAELDQLRLLAGGQSCIPKMQELLGPMSLWSAAGLKEHIEREIAAALAALKAAQPASPAPLTDFRSLLHSLYNALEIDHVRKELGEGWSYWLGQIEKALASPQVAPVPKPLDDPRLQQSFGDAIEGALAFGFQGNNPPPEGHWLARFWNIGRAEATKAAAPVQVAPTGWKLVPVEPTDSMLSAGDEHMVSTSDLPSAWESMLDAAPSVPAPVAPQDDARDAAEPAREREAVRNRYCGARMCLEEDEEHNVSCRRHTPAAKPTEEQGS